MLCTRRGTRLCAPRGTTDDMNRILLNRLIAVWTLLSVLPSPASAQTSDDLARMSMDALLQIKVTSASKKEEPLYHTAAAMYVITQKQIRRSNATSVVDLLRVVPGLEVAQISSKLLALAKRVIATSSEAGR
jgi:outer membrane receptor for ferrienterochelin and colicin